jgi:Uma2 family endonuclease
MKGMRAMTVNVLTANDYLVTGDSRPRCTELIEGEVVVNNPTVRHQTIASFIHFELMAWIRGATGRGHSPGQLDIKFNETTVLAPDVLWISEGRLPIDGAYLSVIPELVVEVRSPSTWRYDTTVKFRIYESAGVSEVWLVDTAANTVLVYRRSHADSETFDVALELGTNEMLTTPLFAGLSINIDSLFKT